MFIVISEVSFTRRKRKSEGKRKKDLRKRRRTVTGKGERGEKETTRNG